MRKFLTVLLSLSFITMLHSQLKVECISIPSTTSTNSFYRGNKLPLKPLPFIPLPVGSIKAGGWLARCLELQTDGLTGHLGEISIWLDKKDNAWIDKSKDNTKGWEEVPYWLRGYALLGYLTGNKQFIDESQIWIDAVLNSQSDDGFFGPVILLNDKRDIWANMLMLAALQNYYDYSGDKRVLTLMSGFFRWELNQPEKELLVSYWDTQRGGDNFNSIIWLYNITGEKWLLDAAEKIHKVTANWAQSDRLPDWHNVNIAEGFREPAQYYQLSGDSSFLKATYRNFNLVRDVFGQVPGGMFGADEVCRIGYSDPRQATETCGFAEQMGSDELLISITGDPFWADHCENVAFNSYPAAFMPDYKSLRYLTAPNLVVSDSKNHFPGVFNQGPFLVMNPFSSRCCQHNHSHGWPYYTKSLWMATPDNGIAAVLYNSCEVTAKVGSGSEVKITEVTKYPFEEKIIFSLSLNKNDTFPLYLRIPAWCKEASVTVNGKPAEGVIVPGKYARINRQWKNNERVELNLPMLPDVKVWYDNRNSASVNYGPLTFSLNIDEKYVKADSKNSAISDSRWQENVNIEKWPSYEIYPESPWNYGLVLNKDTAASFTIEKRNWPEDNYPFTRESTPFIIKAKGKIIPEWQIDSTGMCGVLPRSPVITIQKTENINLIPMGAARLRISSFPVTAVKE
jgi:hypothetical protein